MEQLTSIEIVKEAMKTLIESKVFILILLELALFVTFIIFNKFMNKKVVKYTSIFASITIFGFYILNYVNTLKVFIDNVSTKLMELIYFPTTLEYVLVMSVSLIIMVITLLSKKKVLFKTINTMIPLSISFLFLCIIEYINKNNIPFDEFSVFTDTILMSLYELAMGLFIIWILGLVVYEIDMFIISKIDEEETVPSLKQIDYYDEDEELVELPKLKEA